GTTTIRVSVTGVPDVQLAVTTAFPEITSLTASPNPIQLPAVGSTAQLVLTAHLSDSSQQPFAGSVQFGSANPPIAVVDSTGLVTALSAGTTIITAVPARFPTIEIPVAVQQSTPTAGEANVVAFSVLNLAEISGGQPIKFEVGALPFSVLNT